MLALLVTVVSRQSIGALEKIALHGRRIKINDSCLGDLPNES